MIDLTVVSMPYVENLGPTPGIYYIKSAAESKGFVSVAKDLNVWFKKQNLDLSKIINYFMQHNIERMDEFCEEHIQTKELMEKYIDENHETFRNSSHIGISIFSVYEIFSAVIFAKLIRENFPAAMIVVGGNGTEDTAPGAKDVGNYFLSNDLADFVVYGEGEESIQYILLGKDHPNVNSKEHKVQISDLNSIAYPNYDDFFDDFPEYKETFCLLSIIGSRGCVRECTFCNVPTIWPNYKFRSGSNIASEMIYHNKKHNVSFFDFGDSLINGSMKAFRDLCNVMAEYHEDESNKRISWSGQFICRSQKQMPFEDFVLMKKGGCHSVSIGIESGSQKVRDDIRKGFTEEDMHHTFESLLENGIGLKLMFIVGYPTETDEDFQQSLDLVTRYAKWKDNMAVKVGKTLRLLDNTPLTTKLTHLYYYDDNEQSEWVSTVVPDLTFEKRVERARIFRKHLLDLGYYVNNIESDENFFNDRLKKRTTI
jgi:radical SAM superfamily enzyme YgiQ (UPF0313 family)